MKAVWTIKPDDLHKCRGVICGNFQEKDPTEQLWTAQADTASVMAALRLSQLEDWDVSKLDIKGAFMYAPLPDDLLVVVRPPPVWERWAWLMKASFGLFAKQSTALGSARGPGAKSETVNSARSPGR